MLMREKGLRMSETSFPDMDIDRLTLAFEDGLEKAFRQDYFDSSIGLLRTSFVLGMAYYAVFSILDIIALTEVSRGILRIRFAFVVPTVLVVFLLSFTDGFQRWWQLGAGIATVVSGAGIVAMTTIPHALARSHYYAGIMLVLIYCYLLIRLRFIWASLAGWIIVGLYVLSVLVYPSVDADVLTVNLFFLVSANVLGMFGGYTLEYYTRRDFYYRHLLREEHARVEAARDGLEERVREKTKELREDIRRRKGVERALRRSEEKHRLLAENTLDVIWQMDMTLTFTYVNPAIEPMTGYLPEEWVGSSLADHCSEESLSEMTSIISDELARAEEHSGIVFETRFHHKDGHAFPATVHGKILFDDDRNPIGFQGTTRDVTERRAREDQLRAYRERLEVLVEERTRELRRAQASLVRQERLAVLGQLAGGVAHELRNPLGAISNGAYFLDLVFAEGQVEPEVKETLQILEREVIRSEQIIGGLLDYAEIGAPIRREIDLNGAVRSTLSRWTVPDDVALVTALDEALPSILADREQLERIMLNLVRNAAQAMPDGGRLTVKTSRASQGSGGAGKVILSVADTGEGIPEEHLERIFEPLFSTRTRGIGLGLALTKRLVEEHGGKVGVESQIGIGSTFTITLPANDNTDDAS